MARTRSWVAVLPGTAHGTLGEQDDAGSREPSYVELGMICGRWNPADADPSHDCGAGLEPRSFSQGLNDPRRRQKRARLLYAHPRPGDLGGAFVYLSPLKLSVGPDRLRHPGNLGEVAKCLALGELRSSIALDGETENRTSSKRLVAVGDSQR